MKKQLLLFCAAALLVLMLMPAAARSEAAEWKDYDQGMAEAKKTGRPVLIDFYTTWCRECRKMEETTFSDPAAMRVLASRFVPVRVDAEKQPALASKYKIFGYPTFVVTDASGNAVAMKVGYMDAGQFKNFVLTVPIKK